MGSAFVVGSSLITLFSVVDDPAVGSDFVGAVNGVLARDLRRTNLLTLNDCLNSEWLPL